MQHALKQFILKALLRATCFLGVYLKSPLLLTMVLLQLPPCSERGPGCVPPHNLLGLWAAFPGLVGWDAVGGDAGCLLTLS